MCVLPTLTCLHMSYIWCLGYEDSVKPNVFVELIKPRVTDTQRRKESIQGEIHVVITPAKIDASFLIHKVLLHVWVMLWSCDSHVIVM